MILRVGATQGRVKSKSPLGRTCGIGILPWNGHLAVEWASCVELASCQFQYIFGRAGCPLYSYSLLDSATPIP
ncbi:MAG: hypothetical protein F6K26_14955 [Moorea sp. SIO2I5]|nr:hypothetical protein [Moorena sp. SIO2I5]